MMHDQQCEANTNTAGMCLCGLRSLNRALYPTSKQVEEMDFIYREKIKHLESLLAAANKRVEKLERIIEDYSWHDMKCVLYACSQGEPTPDGGYRVMYEGKWYQSRPIDEAPKCTCGRDDAIAAAKLP